MAGRSNAFVKSREGLSAGASLARLMGATQSRTEVNVDSLITNEDTLISTNKKRKREENLPQVLLSSNPNDHLHKKTKENQSHLGLTNPKTLNLPQLIANPISKPLQTTTGSYIYTRLSDLKEGTANVFCICVDYTVPRPTQGPDWMASVTLVDPSCPDKSSGLCINIFAPSENQLPHFTRIGDTFRAHRLKIQRFGNKFQGVGNVKSGFSWLALHNSNDPNTFAQTSSSPQFTFTSHDEEKSLALRLWRNDVIGSLQKESNSDKYLRKIEDIEPLTYFDLICKIIETRNTANLTGSPQLMLWVWDGTKNGLDKGESFSSFNPSKPKEIPEVEELTTKLPLVVWDHLASKLKDVKEGSWIRLRNITAKVEEMGLEAIVKTNSSFLLLEEDDERVVNLQEQFEMKEKKVLESLEKQFTVPQIRKPIGAGATRISHYGVSVLPISEVLGWETPTNKFRIKGKLVGEIVPNNPSNWTFWDKKGDRGMWQFCLKLRVEDESGGLDVIVFGEDGEKFFGVPPVNLKENEWSRKSVEKMMKKLKNSETLSDFCVKSYYVDENRLDLRHYRVFDTAIV